MATKEKKIPVVKEIKEVKVKKDKKLKPPKLTKKSIIKTFFTAIPTALSKLKKSKKKFKTDEEKFVKQEKDTIIDFKNQASTATKGAEDTYNALSDAQKKIHDAGTSKGMSKAKILAYIAGGGTLAGLTKFSLDVKKKMSEMNQGGYVKMKRGGSVKKRAKSSSKKSRGTGAAIRGTKFKGVF
tara:strand:- start:348 stop:896 length:549 start_codon:yes stop_codon:yes gene_type:complete